MDDFVKEILITQEQIAQRVQQMGEQISQDYQGEEVVLISVLKGAMVFTADLMRQMNIPVILETMIVSSYGNGIESSGEVKIILDCKTDLKGKNVLVVDDIIDTGTTLMCLCQKLGERQPKSLKSCAFLDKPSRRKVNFAADYIGYEIPDAFAIGYGLDYDGYYRDLPYIGVIKEEYVH